jgi:NAD(P)-dependent dehydrogenase (short-subunit alcohol dehydrogenase family)
VSEGLCVVAGAGGVIGQAIVGHLLDEGASVLGIGRSPLDVPRPGLQWCVADLHDESCVDLVRGAVAGRPVDLLVSAARPHVGAGPLAEIHPADLARAVDLKVGGLLRLVRAVASALRPGARVVALGGRYGREPDPRAAAAGVCNAALENLAMQLAVELAPRGIAVHVLAPARVHSTRTPVEESTSTVPVLRPEDVAAMVGLLRRSPATGALTGQALAMGWPGAPLRGRAGGATRIAP